jgi:hypothetical protein
VTDAEHLARIRAFLRTLLEPMPLGHGPIRIERWAPKWTQAQREAYVELRKEAEAEEAGGPMDPSGPWG